jgi:hypothetical protein
VRFVFDRVVGTEGAVRIAGVLGDEGEFAGLYTLAEKLRFGEKIGATYYPCHDDLHSA